MDLNYFDAHMHLNFDAFDEGRAAVVAKMTERGIGGINVGVDLQTSRESVELADRHDHIWAAVGVHPTEASEGFASADFKNLVEKKRVVAVGECGLDYYREANRTDEDKRRQKQVFRAQVEFALEHDLPLILHLRPKQGTMDAYEDGLDILEEYAASTDEGLRGTAHFFVGSTEIAQRFFKLGFYISWTGVVTLTDEFDETIERVSTEKVLVETDAPFAAPVPYRGERNSPLYIPDIVTAIANKRRESSAMVAREVRDNTIKLFELESI